MTMLGPIDLSLLGGDFFRSYTDIQPFSYRDGMTYTSELEALRTWTFRTLVPFLNENFSDMQDSWEVNVHTLTDAINAGLAAQTADNASRIAAALTAIAEADIPITDPGVLAVLNLSTTATRGWLDAHYQPVGNYQPAGDYQPAGAYQPAGTYLQPTVSARNPVTGWFHVDDFGAAGDGTTPDQAGIQAAIDAANTAYMATGVPQRVQLSPKVYLCGNTATSNPVYALMLKSGVEIVGPGTLRVAPGSYWVGTQYAMLRSPEEGIQEAGLRNLSIDGNRAAFNVPGDVTACNNITLGPCNGVSIIGVKSYSASGTGIMVAGHSNNLSHDVKITGCTVSNCGNIGIQCAQFDGLTIEDNDVSWTHDNGIDIYGEPDSHIGASTGINFRIVGNRIHDCGNGIFPETVAKGIISDNHILTVGEGIHVNRINAEPNDILITGNSIFGAESAIGLTGDTGGVTIRNNLLEWFNTAGVVLGGAGNVGGYYILDNTMNGNSDNTAKVLIRSGTNQVSSIMHRGTVTRSKNRAVDTVNSGPAPINCSFAPAVAPGDF